EGMSRILGQSSGRGPPFQPIAEGFFQGKPPERRPKPWHCGPAFSMLRPRTTRSARRLEDPSMNALLLAAIGTLAQAQAGDDPAPLPRSADAPPSRMLKDHLIAGAKSAFAVRRDAVAAIKTPEALKARQEGLRAKFLAALGGLPERTPLNARVVGRIARD